MKCRYLEKIDKLSYSNKRMLCLLSNVANKAIKFEA